MRIFIGFLFLLSFRICFAQTDLTWSFPEYQAAFRDSAVLYRGYDNRLVLEVGTPADSLVLESDQVSITWLGNSRFIFRVSGTSRRVQVQARNHATGKVAKLWEFQVANLPYPILNWGIYPDSSVVSLDQAMLRADYGKNSLLGDTGFEIESYEVSSLLLEKPVRVSGELITPEVVDALKKAKALNGGKPILFGVMAKVRNKREGVLRKKSAVFTY